MKNEILEMALAGFKQERARLDARIEEIEIELRASGHGEVTRLVRRQRRKAAADTRLAGKGFPGKKKRTMSPEGRARVAAAQKERWAKVHAAA